MKACRKMKELVTQIVTKHGVDLDDPDLELWFEIEGCNPLVIQRWGPTLLSVETCYARDDERVGNPRVIFFTGQDGWEPVELVGYQGIPLVCAVLDERHSQITAVNTHAQGAITRVIEALASKYENQGWLAEGQRIEPEPTLTPQMPTVLEPPDLRTFLQRQFGQRVN